MDILVIGATETIGSASAPLTPLADDAFEPNLAPKLLGQVRVARVAVGHLRDGGSITLTSGRIPEATPGSAGGRRGPGLRRRHRRLRERPDPGAPLIQRA